MKLTEIKAPSKLTKKEWKTKSKAFNGFSSFSFLTVQKQRTALYRAIQKIKKIMLSSNIWSCLFVLLDVYIYTHKVYLFYALCIYYTIYIQHHSLMFSLSCDEKVNKEWKEYKANVSKSNHFYRKIYLVSKLCKLSFK